jgi:phenylpyruvate tautomerase
MPYLKINTNQTLPTDECSALMRKLSQQLAQETGKPEQYVMIEWQGGKNLLFAGSDQPSAFLECKSIGLSARQCTALSASLSDLLRQHLPLAQDRIYIEFSNAAADYWGWNGSTFG